MTSMEELYTRLRIAELDLSKAYKSEEFSVNTRVDLHSAYVAILKVNNSLLIEINKELGLSLN